MLVILGSYQQIQEREPCKQSHTFCFVGFAFQLLLLCLTICSSGQEAFLNMAVTNFVDLEDKVNFKGRGNVTDESFKNINSGL